MRANYHPMYDFLIVDYFRTLQWHFRNCHLKVDMKLVENNRIQIRIPIGKDYFAMITIWRIIKIEFFHIEWATPRLQSIKPIKVTLNLLPEGLSEIFEFSESGLFIYPHSPSLDILKVISYIDKHNAEMLVMLEGANMIVYENQSVEPF